jgi:hypothetical protein
MKSKILFAFGFLWVVFLLAWPAHRPDFSDFWVYYGAGIEALHHRTVYAVLGHYQFKYAPTVALLFGALFAQMPGDRAAWIFYGINLLLWPLLGFLFLSKARATKSRAELAAILCFLLGLAFKEELRLGQTNGLAILLLWLAVSAKKPVVRGSCLALAIQLKLYAVFAIPLFLIRKQTQALVAAAAMAMASFGVLVLFHGFSFAAGEISRWVVSLTQSSEILFTSTYNVNLAGTLSRWGFGWLSGPSEALGLVIFIYGWMRAMATKLKDDSLWQMGWMSGGIVLLNPLVWPYWILFLMPALTWIFDRSSLHSNRRIALFVGLLVSFNSLAGYVGKNAGGVLLGMLWVAGLLLHSAFDLHHLGKREAFSHGGTS